MSQESKSEDNKLVPLRHSRSASRADAEIEITEDKLRSVLRETLAEALDKRKDTMSEDKLRGILFDVVDQRITRLENSIHQVISQFEAVRSGEAEDAALRVTTDDSATDLALAEINLPREDFYPYTATLLADKLKIAVHHVSKMVKKFDLKDNSRYHCVFRTGRVSKTDKWSEGTFLRLKTALDSGEYLIPD
ncbi:hypothetical protein H6F86_01975 [Phormidium sp. FACHB-592]|uniref:Uncharacterized protein n=1 Tax=Stenomitos frigidus AS-A4 TaxID=2933935 RepID=A0ABV0KJP1_9CYAN|nr:hypothetical protein [Phormidium sp. FACHB-592]MBD2072674.1 hypothetical protein [Phormidium sp. FACHB-592]